MRERLLHCITLGLASVCSTLLPAGCCFICSEQLPPTDIPPPEYIIHYGYEVVNTYPHDPGAFTQGLDYADGFLYEGTGLHGESSLRKVVLVTGEILQQHDLARAYFGEGIAIHGDKIVQLTWKSQVGFVYQRDTFERIGDFSYVGEGWGITHDGERFIMSDGTTQLRFLDMNTYQETGRLYVRDGNASVSRLNELEYVNGTVYANIWQEDRIAMICPASGYVTGWIDLRGLLTAAEARHANELNGIAWDEEQDRLFVTGKRWPKLFEIRLVEKRREKTASPTPG